MSPYCVDARDAARSNESIDGIPGLRQEGCGGKPLTAPASCGVRYVSTRIEHHKNGDCRVKLALAGELAVLDLRLHEVAVEIRDEVEADLFRTGLVALAVVGARAEVHLHRLDHVLDAGPPFGLPLRQEVEVLDLCRREQLRGGVRTRGNTGTAADASRGVEGRVGGLLRYGDEVGVGRRARIHRDVAAGLDDAIERTAIDGQIADDRERGRP